MPEEDVTKPPDTPPGEPGTEADKKPDATAAPAVSLTREQLTDLVRESVSSVITGLTPKTPVVASTPTGPDPTVLRTEVNTLDAQIDQAVQEGKPIAALQRKRDELRDQIFEAEHVTPLRTQGSEAINDVVLAQMRNDPDLGDLFKQYEPEIRETLLKGLRAGTPLRMEWVRECTNMVIGRHLPEIRQRDKDATLRASKLDTPTPVPGSTNGRTMKQGQEKLPETIREQFGDRAAEAFRFKERKGHTPESFARTLGFANREEWFKRDRELADNPTLGLDK